MLNASYVEGHAPTQKDVSLYNAISKPAACFPHALRWYSHIGSFSAAKIASLPGTPETIAPPPESAKTPAGAPAPAPVSPEGKKEKKEKPAKTAAPAATPGSESKKEKKEKKKE